MKLKEKLKEFGTKTKNFVVKNWKPLVLGTVTVGGVIYAIVCKKKINDALKSKEIEIKEWKIGDFVGCYEWDQFTEAAANYVPMKELGELGKEAVEKIPGVTEDTLVCVHANFLKWRPEGK